MHTCASASDLGLSTLADVTLVHVCCIPILETTHHILECFSLPVHQPSDEKLASCAVPIGHYMRS